MVNTILTFVCSCFSFLGFICIILYTLLLYLNYNRKNAKPELNINELLQKYNLTTKVTHTF